MQLWTTWAIDESEYERFFMAAVSTSNNKTSAHNKFEAVYGLHALDAVTEEGIIRNSITEKVFSEKVFQFLEESRCSGSAFFVFASVGYSTQSKMVKEAT